jgi:hypothetical protein
MSNPTFTTAAAGTPPPDPSKHVNYIQGMVLGVDDFQQEFAYLSHRDQWLARDAIGYGTVCGLHVSIDPADLNVLSVSPGAAINPRGQLIRVAPRQCARLDAWLALPATVERLNALGLGATDDVQAYVVLCYRDCPTDELPVPGEPCRCDSTTMAPTRILDDFRLELTLEPPPQSEEDAIRDFVTWLRGIEVAEFEPAAGDLEAFLQAVKDAVTGASPPQSPPDFLVGSPPEWLRIPRHLLCEWMRAVLRLWVTELRPLWQAQCGPQKSCACGGPCGCHGTGAQPDDMACDCLLLAAVRITRGGGGITGAVLDEERRPYVVHLRMLQELLLCGPSCCDSCGHSRTFATVFALDQDTLRIWIHHPFQLTVPDAAVALKLGGTSISDFAIAPAGFNIFDLTLTGSPLAAIGNSTTIELEFDASLIQESGGDPLVTVIWQQKYCYADYHEPLLRVFTTSEVLALGGDVVGPPANNQLVAIHGDPLDLTGLTSQRVLGFDSGKWHPVPLPLAAIQIPKPLGVVGSKGVSLTNYALEDHVHPGPQPATIAPKPHASAGSVGTTTTKYALEDHIHPGPQPATVPPPANGGLGSIGIKVNKYALEDHSHPAPPPPVIPQPGDNTPKPDAGNGAPGTSINYSREDHVHPLQKVSGDFVEHPPVGPYAIVAAGHLNSKQRTVDPAYNQLRILDIMGESDFLLTYGPENPSTPLEGYLEPKKHAYIIKGTSFGETAGLFHVIQFQSNGFVVSLGAARNRAAEVMIEVSMYPLEKERIKPKGKKQ